VGEILRRLWIKVPSASKRKLGVVQGAAVALVHADGEIHGVVVSDGTERVAGRSGHVDRLVGKTPIPLAVRPRRRPPHPIGIRGDERLREHDEVGVVRGRLLGEPSDLVDRGLTVEEDGRGLDRGDRGAAHVPDARAGTLLTSSPGRALAAVIR
jgi:hypothetical protein